MTDHSDKRKHPRVEVILKVEYSTPNAFVSDYASNASGGGMFVATTHPFRVGDQLTFDISFPGIISPIRCNGEVKWQRTAEMASDEDPAGIGVAFIFRSAEEARQIQSLLDKFTKTQPVPAPASPGRAFRVLVAEYNPLVREMLRFGVRKFHGSKLSSERRLEVVEAENGKEAWEQVSQGSIDLAIVDFFLPVIGGSQLIQKIRSTEGISKLPIIVVSVGDDEAKKEAYKAGADLFLDKPILLGKLFSALQRLLGLEGETK